MAAVQKQTLHAPPWSDPAIYILCCSCQVTLVVQLANPLDARGTCGAAPEVLVQYSSTIANASGGNNPLALLSHSALSCTVALLRGLPVAAIVCFCDHPCNRGEGGLCRNIGLPLSAGIWKRWRGTGDDGIDTRFTLSEKALPQLQGSLHLTTCRQWADTALLHHCGTEIGRPSMDRGHAPTNTFVLVQSRYWLCPVANNLMDLTSGDSGDRMVRLTMFHSTRWARAEIVPCHQMRH